MRKTTDPDGPRTAVSLMIYSNTLNTPRVATIAAVADTRSTNINDMASIM